jgi:hypothetical protein
MIYPVNPAIKNSDIYYPGDKTYPEKGFRGLTLSGKIKFAKILFSSYGRLNSFHSNALNAKECYIGPFWGELGNFLLHFLPYIAYLHDKGVKVNACCIENYASFMIDEEGKPLCKDVTLVRNFFSEVRPSGNSVQSPADVWNKFEEFRKRANASGYPLLDLSDNDLYWYVFRNWQLNGKQKLYQLEKKFKKEDKNNIVIFPRKKGGGYTLNNGGEWDYMSLARAASPFFDDVVFTGRPDMSAEVRGEGNIKLQLSDDNNEILRSCANAKLIITQHSGAMHLGSYVNVPVLLVFNGKLPVKGLDDSDRFRKNIGRKNVYLALTEVEVVDFLKRKEY